MTEYFHFRSIRAKRILEWRILCLLLIFILAISGICLHLYLSVGTGEDYDYFYFQHESLELFGAYESNEGVRISNPAIIKRKQNEESLLPVIFIGGYPRSGAKVVKELIEYYAKIKCNNQTYVIPDFLHMKAKWDSSQLEVQRLNEAGIDAQLLTSSFAILARGIVIGQSPKSQGTHCVHENASFKYGVYLKQYFPTAKFIFVVRDGRAVIHSLLTQLHPREDYGFDSYRDGFIDWGQDMKVLMSQCEFLGNDKCYIVRFEDLFVAPWETLQALFNFLGTHFENPLDLSRSAIRNTSTVFDYLSQRPSLDQESLNQAAVIDDVLTSFGYDPKLFVAGNSAQDFDT